MRLQFRNLDTWRGKLAATWACLAPPAALVAVVVGGGGPSDQFVVDANALGQSRQDSLFDDLARDVPSRPGADGNLGTGKRSGVEVPVIGTEDGKPQLPTGITGDTSGIPGSVLAAYQRAATEVAGSRPACGITWPLLAGIGKVESAHASGGRVDATGLTRGRILGPVLDGGPGMAAITDTDQGRYDGDTRWDRAVGPMQFIPGTWVVFGADGNGDGVKDPHNVYDAARAAGEYLCAGGSDLHDSQGLVQAVLRYNHSMDYVSTVLRWMQSYSNSAVTIPDSDGVVPPPADNGNVEKGGDPGIVTVADDQQPLLGLPTTGPTRTSAAVPTQATATKPPTSATPPTKPVKTPKPPAPALPPMSTSPSSPTKPTTAPTPSTPTTPAPDPTTPAPTTPTSPTPTTPAPTTPTPTTPATPSPTPTPTPTPTSSTPAKETPSTPTPTPTSRPTPTPTTSVPARETPSTPTPTPCPSAAPTPGVTPAPTEDPTCSPSPQPPADDGASTTVSPK